MNDDERPIDTFVKRSMETMQKEYLVIGKTRVSRFTSWTVLAFFLGMTLTIGFLASRTGTLEQSEAARAPRVPKPVYSRWSKAQEGSCEGKTSATQQCRLSKVRKRIIEGGKRITVQGFQTRSCVKNCERLVSDSGSLGDFDEIRLDFRYLRDYFTPQVTGLGFHREIKCKHFEGANGNCANIKLGQIFPSSFTPSPYTQTEHYTQQNGIITWRVPKTTKNYSIYFNSVFWDEDIMAHYQICPTNKSIRCANRVQEIFFASIGTSLEAGVPLIWLSFTHNAGVNETINLFGMDINVWQSNAGGFLNGKHSVRFYGDESGLQVPVGNNWGTIITTGIDIGFNIFDDGLPRSAASFPDIVGQTPVNVSLAKNKCVIDVAANVSQGSSLGAALVQASNDIFEATGLMRVNIAGWDSGRRWQDVATQESDSSLGFDVCDKNSRCGEDGTNDIVFTSDMPHPLYGTLANEDPEMRAVLIQAGFNPGQGTIAAANWYGVTGSRGNNDIAVIMTEGDIVIKSNGLDLSSPVHRKALRIVLAHELSHYFVGRGANEVFVFDNEGKPHMLTQSGSFTANNSFWGKIVSSLFQTTEAKSRVLLTKEQLKDIYKDCEEQPQQPYHPLISVEQ